jgi:hypothetical protein
VTNKTLLALAALFELSMPLIGARVGKDRRKIKPMYRLAIVLLLGMPIASFAQTYGEESARRVAVAERIEPVGAAAFGEQLSLYNGTLKFRTVDVSLPSNNGLKVEFARLLGGNASENFWGWDIDVPKISGLMPTDWTGGWTPDPPETAYNQAGVPFAKRYYWSGFTLQVDGESTPLLYRGSDTRIATPGGSSDFRFMTKAGWALRVVPAASGVGSTLIAFAPDGTKYYFDHLVTSFYSVVQHPTKFRTVVNSGPGYSVTSVFPEVLDRNQQTLFVSRIEDRFGNWVNYEWQGARLARIYANDGREIVIASDKVLPQVSEAVDDRYEVRTVTASGRVWQYNSTVNASGFITWTVTNPDLSTWAYEGSPDGPIGYAREYTGTDFVQHSLLHDIMTCTKAYDFTANQSKTLKVKNPSGATATYQLVPMRHGRTNVPYGCMQMSDDQNTWNNLFTAFDDVWSLVKKTVTGVGLQTLETTYRYEGLASAYEPSAAALVAPGETLSLPNYKTVTVTEPDGRSMKLVYGRDWGTNEGFLMSVRAYSAQGQLLRQTDNAYLSKDEALAQPFPLDYGDSGVAFSDKLASWNLLLRSTNILQDGVIFTNAVNTFDIRARPLSITKSSTRGL